MSLTEFQKYYQTMRTKFLMFILSLFFVNFFLSAQEVNENDSTKNKSNVILLEDDENFRLLEDTTVNANKKLETDTLTNVRKKGNPVAATLCSMVIPGLGQAYNKKYWKIPIIYTLFGSMYYFARNNHQKYKDFKFAYKHFEDKSLKPIWVRENVKEDYLKNRMNFYKRNRNFNIIVIGIFYFLNILDANVDAHFMDFDVGDDLSMKVEPDINLMFENNLQIPNFGLKFVIAINN